MKPLGIRQRILLAALAPALLVFVVLAALFSLNHMESAYHNQHHRLAAVARQLAAAAQYEVFVDNRDALKRLLDAAREEPDIVGAAYRSADGSVIVSSPPHLEVPAAEAAIEGFSSAARSDAQVHWHSLPIQAHPDEVDLFSAADDPTRQTIGHLLVKVSNASLEGQMRKLAVQALAVSIGALLLALLLALALSRGLIHTLGDILGMVAGIGRGRHDLRIIASANDELGQLAQGINRMAEAVGQTQEELAARIDEATATLRHERDTAAQAADSRRRFFDAASHDLRQPVQALGLFVAQLEREAGIGALRPRIRKIGQIVHSLQRILDTLLDYSRLDGQVFQPELQPVRAAQAIHLAVEGLAPLAQEKQLDLRIRNPLHDCWLLTDPILLHRILVNLVGNAVKHTRRGRILVACRRYRHHARIEVWDTGPGVPAEYQQAIFKEFVQLDNPERDANKGLGLGLAIVRRLTDLLSHPLMIRSRVGQGSCFSLQIPLAEGACEEGERSDERLRILIFGAPGNADAELAPLLERWDYRADFVGRVDELNDWIARHCVPDCLIYLAAPGEDSSARNRLIEVLDRLEAETGLTIPTLFVGDTAPSGEERGARVHLGRPIRPARLRALLSHLVGS